MPNVWNAITFYLLSIFFLVLPYGKVNLIPAIPSWPEAGAHKSVSSRHGDLKSYFYFGKVTYHRNIKGVLYGEFLETRRKIRLLLQYLVKTE